MNNELKTKLQNEILNHLDNKTSGRLVLAPRTGKSKIIVDLIKKYKFKSILWVTPFVELAFNDIPNEFKKWGGSAYLKNLTTSTWKSLNTVTGKFDIIILDEDQYVTVNNISSLLNKSLTYGLLISMTGTDSKDLSKKNLFKLLKLKTIYELTINKSVELGLLANYNINVVEIPLSKVKNIPAGNKKVKFLTSEESQYNYLNKVAEQALARRRGAKFPVINRMRFIKNSLSKENTAITLIKKLEGKKLVFCPTIKQADKLSENSYHSKNNTKGGIGNENLRKFQNDEIDLLTLVNTGGAGFTYKSLDHLIIIQSDSDNNGATSQKMCRTLLSQDNYSANIWVLCLKNTKDENWVNSALKSFDSSKIKRIGL